MPSAPRHEGDSSSQLFKLVKALLFSSSVKVSRNLLNVERFHPLVYYSCLEFPPLMKSGLWKIAEKEDKHQELTKRSAGMASLYDQEKTLENMSIWSLTCSPLLICSSVVDIMKPHYGSHANDLMSRIS